MNPVYEQTKRDSILSAFTKEIGKQSGVSILFSDSIYTLISFYLRIVELWCDAKYFSNAPRICIVANFVYSHPQRQNQNFTDTNSVHVNVVSCNFILFTVAKHVITRRHFLCLMVAAITVN